MERPAQRPVPRRLIELSHQIRHGMITYPGLPGPELGDYLPRETSPARYGPGTEFHIGHISMVANTGTYLDSPLHPFASATDVAAADCLVEQQAGLVGIDSLNIDDTSGPSRPVHAALLAAGIPIVEHLCGLDQLPPSGFRFHAAPPPVAGIGSFPVRAYAVMADV